MAHFLVYLKPGTVLADEHVANLPHSASNQYDRLSTRDVLWIVTSEGVDDLVLVGRQQVDRIVNQAEAEKLTLNRQVWQAKYHAVCDHPEQKMLIDISRRAMQLGFEGAIETLPSGFSGKNLQTMRRLDDDSAEMLQKIWDGRHDDRIICQGPDTN
jgi:hypothetical protein